MKITKRKLKQIIKEEIESSDELISSIRQLIDSIETLDLSVDYMASALTGDDAIAIGGTQKSIGRAAKAKMREQEINEADGKGCADTDKGCIRKRADGWVILNNKKGGIFRKCDSRSHCDEILDAFHASKG